MGIAGGLIGDHLRHREGSVPFGLGGGGRTTGPGENEGRGEDGERTAVEGKYAKRSHLKMVAESPISAVIELRLPGGVTLLGG